MSLSQASAFVTSIRNPFRIQSNHLPHSPTLSYVIHVCCGKIRRARQTVTSRVGSIGLSSFLDFSRHGTAPGHERSRRTECRRSSKEIVELSAWRTSLCTTGLHFGMSLNLIDARLDRPNKFRTETAKRLLKNWGGSRVEGRRGEWQGRSEAHPIHGAVTSERRRQTPLLPRARGVGVDFVAGRRCSLGRDRCGYRLCQSGSDRSRLGQRQNRQQRGPPQFFNSLLTFFIPLICLDQIELCFWSKDDRHVALRIRSLTSCH